MRTRREKRYRNGMVNVRTITPERTKGRSALPPEQRKKEKKRRIMVLPKIKGTQNKTGSEKRLKNNLVGNSWRKETGTQGKGWNLSHAA